MRLIFYTLVIFAIYWLIRSLLKPKPKKKINSQLPPQIEDELVKDPMCGIYIPKQKAITAKIGGKVYYFCSQRCKEEYTKRQEVKK